MPAVQPGSVIEPSAFAPPRVLGRFFRTGLLTIISQVVTALQLALLVAEFKVSRTSDAYLLLWTAAAAPVAIAAQGVGYNFAIGRPGYARWGRLRFFSVAVSGLAVGGAGLLVMQPRFDNAISWPTIAAFVTGTMAYGLVALRGVELVCVGRPTLGAAYSIPGTLLTALIELASVLDLIGPNNSLPAVAWMTGNVCFLVLVLLRPKPNYEGPVAAQGGPLADRSVLVGLTVSACAGFVGPLVLQALAARLPAGQLTVVALGAKVCQAVVGVGINALLMATTSWLMRPRWLAKFGTGFLLASNWVALTGCVAMLIVPSAGTSLALGLFFAVGWTSASAAGALLLREVVLDRQQALRRTVPVCVVVGYVAALAVFAGHQNGSTFFGALLAAQTGVCLGAVLGLRQRRLVVVGSVAVLLLCSPVLALS